MAKNPWVSGSQAISRLMRKDTIRLYKSIPEQDDIGERADNPVLIGEYAANVTTPPEAIGEDIQGATRTHYYEITLDPSVELPLDSKLFVELVSVRQGQPGAMVEVTDIQGGMLGYTLSAADEQS